MAKLSVDPGLVCDRARHLVLDGETMKAVHLLGEGFSGLDLASSYAILRGDSILAETGDGIDLVADETPSAAVHKASLASIYGHRVRIGGTWREPYAIVDGLGERDLDTHWGLPDGARERAYHAWVGTARGANIDRSRNRSTIQEACRPLHYARDPARDLVLYIRDEAAPAGRARPPGFRERPRPVLFGECGAPPPWMTGAHSPEAALTAGLREGAVDRRGHGTWYAPPSGPETSAAAAAPEPSRPAPAAVARPSPAARAAAYVFAPSRSPEEEAAFGSKLPAVRHAIMSQAANSGGYIPVDLGDGAVRVPRAPFERWALKRVGGLHLAPAWTPVSPPDLKVAGDDRDHSDWLIGAGYDPFAWHGPGEAQRRFREAGYEAMHRLQDERLGKVHHAVLCGEGTVAGPVWIARRGELPSLGSVVVLPDASPAWMPAVQAAIGANPGIGGVIVEEGGAMAHLVTVLRPGGVPVIRWPGARAALADAAEARIDCADGSVEVLGYRIDEGPEPDSAFGM